MYTSFLCAFTPTAGAAVGVNTALEELATNEFSPPLVTVPENVPVPALVMLRLESITVVPLLAIDPATSSFCAGLLVPTPTFPEFVLLILLPLVVHWACTRMGCTTPRTQSVDVAQRRKKRKRL